MIKYIALGFITLCLFNIVAHAGEKIPGHKDEAGLGLGAIIGGLIGGPPGAIIGAAGGVLFGSRENRKDEKTARLQEELQDKNLELALADNRIRELQETYGKELQHVMLNSDSMEMTGLANAVSFSVYFRTNSAEPDAEIITQLQKLAGFLKDKPDINLQLEAHADRRGSVKYNHALSKKRAATVRQILQDTGIPDYRLFSHALGETQALAAEGDSEGYVFDRRVDIELTLDTRI